MPADVAGQDAQDVSNFLALVVPQHLQFLVQGDAGAGLDEGDGSGVGGAQDGTAYLALVAADHCQGPALLHEALAYVREVSAFLHGLHGSEKRPVHFAANGRHVLADAREFRRGVVPDVALRVEDGVDGLDEFRAGFLALEHSLEARPRFVRLGQDLKDDVHDARGG